MCPLFYKTSWDVIDIFNLVVNDHLVKGAASPSVHLKKFGLNLNSSSLLVICVNLLHL